MTAVATVRDLLGPTSVTAPDVLDQTILQYWYDTDRAHLVDFRPIGGDK